MNEQLEHEFQQIGRRALDEAGAVRCTISEFISGLMIIADDLQTSLEAANEDLLQEQKETERTDDDGNDV